MDEYDWRMEMAGNAEGVDNTEPDAPDAPGCFVVRNGVRVPLAEDLP
jgi:hypothetical protein